ncbi:MAG: CAP domain-containing protein [Gemmatimonadales bacterium]|nr:MAG: CAP domain-containing protein [Gemmatimonadales bacterium]
MSCPCRRTSDARPEVDPMDRIPRIALLVLLAATHGCAPMERGSAAPAGSTGDDPPGPHPAAETTPPPTGEPASPSQVPGGDEARWESLLNGVRAQPRDCGGDPYAAAPPLRWDPRLGTAARGHSRDMATTRTLNHAGSDGRTPWDRIAAAGYEFSAVAENVAGGQPDARAAVESWIRSPGHCVNLMNPAFRDFGAAGERGSNGTMYWTLKLGASF